MPPRHLATGPAGALPKALCCRVQSDVLFLDTRSRKLPRDRVPLEAPARLLKARFVLLEADYDSLDGRSSPLEAAVNPLDARSAPLERRLGLLNSDGEWLDVHSRQLETGALSLNASGTELEATGTWLEGAGAPLESRGVWLKSDKASLEAYGAWLESDGSCLETPDSTRTPILKPWMPQRGGAATKRGHPMKPPRREATQRRQPPPARRCFASRWLRISVGKFARAATTFRNSSTDEHGWKWSGSESFLGEFFPPSSGETLSHPCPSVSSVVPEAISEPAEKNEKGRKKSKLESCFLSFSSVSFG